MEPAKTVVFLCPHNAAKSVVAAAYWNRLAQERGLAVHARSAGTEPSPAVSPAVVTALRAEGIDVADHIPRRVRADELASAWRVVSMGCAPDALGAARAVAYWDEVPAASEDLPASLAAIATRVQRLLEEAD
jgi:arsenate reductase (thioredoxin)